MCVKAVLATLRDAAFVSEEDKRSMLLDFADKLPRDGWLPACAACGVRDPARSYSTCQLTPTMRRALRLPPERAAILDRLRQVSLYDPQGSLMATPLDLRLLVGHTVLDGELLALHPQFVSEGGETPTCTMCHRCSSAFPSTAPAYCLASGVDYGNLQALRRSNASVAAALPELTDLERVVLADSRSYASVLKATLQLASDVLA